MEEKYQNSRAKTTIFVTNTENKKLVIAMLNMSHTKRQKAAFPIQLFEQWEYSPLAFCEQNLCEFCSFVVNVCSFRRKGNLMRQITEKIKKTQRD